MAKEKKADVAVTNWEGGVIYRWVADNRARRVPLFVITTTGMRTKTEVVAKFGVGCVFDNKAGKAVLVRRGIAVNGDPAPRAKPAAKEPRGKAKGPLARKMRKAGSREVGA
jgi:hypothetical protein